MPAFSGGPGRGHLTKTIGAGWLALDPDGDYARLAVRFRPDSCRHALLCPPCRRRARGREVLETTERSPAALFAIAFAFSA